MNNKYHYFLVMNRYALFASMIVVSCGLCAQNFLKSQNLDLCSYTWTITAEFVDPDPPSYGFDDYTWWNPQDAYYSSHRNGKCDLPFISVKAGQEGKAKLKIQYNTLNTSLNLSVDENKITDFPPSLIYTTTFSFNTSLPEINNNNEYEKKYDAIMSAEVTRIVDNILAESMIECYLEKEITVNVVRVNGATGTPDFSKLAKQAILNININYISYPKGYITLPNGIVKFLHNNIVWSLEMLNTLADEYIIDNNIITNNGYTMFIIDGSFTGGGNIAGWARNIGDTVSWVLDSYVSGMACPHELGHCLGLRHREKDNDALMYPTIPASGSNAQKLRQSEWDVIHQ